MPQVNAQVSADDQKQRIIAIELLHAVAAYKKIKLCISAGVSSIYGYKALLAAYHQERLNIIRNTLDGKIAEYKKYDVKLNDMGPDIQREFIISWASTSMYIKSVRTSILLEASGNIVPLNVDESILQWVGNSPDNNELSTSILTWAQGENCLSNTPIYCTNTLLLCVKHHCTTVRRSVANYKARVKKIAKNKASDTTKSHKSLKQNDNHDKMQAKLIATLDRVAIATEDARYTLRNLELIEKRNKIASYILLNGKLDDNDLTPSNSKDLEYSESLLSHDFRMHIDTYSAEPELHGDNPEIPSSPESLDEAQQDNNNTQHLIPYPPLYAIIPGPVNAPYTSGLNTLYTWADVII